MQNTTNRFLHFLFGIDEFETRIYA